MSEVCDAAVIGAGPAGSVAAGLLARRGLRVVLFDQAHFPRRKVCGCCLNANALAALAAADLGDLPARLGAVPLRQVRLAAGGRTADLTWPAGVSLSRDALDTELVNEAVRRGAEFRPGTRATMREEVDGRRRVELKSGAMIHARVVIVADGLNGQLAGDATAGSRIGAGAILPATADYPAGTVFMATAAGGYVGLVRLEDDRLDLAAAFDAAFVRANGGLGAAAGSVLAAAGLPPVPGLAAADWKGTPALTRAARRVAGRGWFAVGDAGGYVEPFTGEGMGWAVSSAVAVVPFVLRTLASGEHLSPDEWPRAYRKLIGRRQSLCRAVAWALRKPAACRAVVRALRTIPRLAGPVVNAIQRPTYFRR